MPPRQPAPRICFQQIVGDNLDQPKETTIKENKKIPKGLPKANPNMMPKSKEVIKVFIENASMTKAVFASAKMGIINSATGI